jgi:hypothetical protein
MRSALVVRHFAGFGYSMVVSGSRLCESNLRLTFTAVNIATDVLLALVPIPLIWTLRMTVLSRLSLIVVLGLGICAAIAGIMRQASMAATFTDSEPWVHDTYVIWTFIELNIGIVAASLPATKPLLSRLYDTAKNLTGGSKTSGFISNKTIHIRQPHPSDIEGFAMDNQSVTMRPHANESANKRLWCNNQRASISGDINLTTFSPVGKGQILVTVTKYVEVHKIG